MTDIKSTMSHENETPSPTIELRVQSVSSEFTSGLLVVRPRDTVSGRIAVSSDLDLRFKTVTVSYIGTEYVSLDALALRELTDTQV